MPEKASLWYGYGMDPYCNLADGSDMAVPVFGPIALDDGSSRCRADRHRAAQRSPAAPVKVLIITGDNVSAITGRTTSKALRTFSRTDGQIKVDVTTTPSKDLTDDNLAKYDVLLLEL